MESNVAINGGGLLPDAVIVGGVLLLDAAVLFGVESPPQAPSIKTDAAPAHRSCRIAGYLANMRTQLRCGWLVSAPERARGFATHPSRGRYAEERRQAASASCTKLICFSASARMAAQSAAATLTV